MRPRLCDGAGTSWNAPYFSANVCMARVVGLARSGIIQRPRRRRAAPSNLCEVGPEGALCCGWAHCGTRLDQSYEGEDGVRGGGGGGNQEDEERGDDEEEENKGEAGGGGGERVTVQGPVKKQQPDGMSHRGGNDDEDHGEQEEAWRDVVLPPGPPVLVPAGHCCPWGRGRTLRRPTVPAATVIHAIGATIMEFTTQQDATGQYRSIVNKEAFMMARRTSRDVDI